MRHQPYSEYIAYIHMISGGSYSLEETAEMESHRRVYRPTAEELLQEQCTPDEWKKIRATEKVLDMIDGTSRSWVWFGACDGDGEQVFPWVDKFDGYEEKDSWKYLSRRINRKWQYLYW
ncbi:MAG: hypothetical protein PHX83_11945 [Acidobacteriia bacterium]|nr:hypothetical protein [Terriglobia bacterium]